jgi:hypothetical protein
LAIVDVTRQDVQAYVALREGDFAEQRVATLGVSRV